MKASAMNGVHFTRIRRFFTRRIRRHFGNIALTTIAALAFALQPGIAQETAPTDGLPVRMSADFKRPEHPFLLVSKEEVAAAREKARTIPWAKEALLALRAEADSIAEDPAFFPKEEAGWYHWYVCPKTGEHLKFDINTPHDHYCPACKTPHQGQLLDHAWLADAMGYAVNQQVKLADAWLLTGEAKYADAMKRFFLDLAAKYPGYRLHDRRMTVFGDKAEPIAGYARCQSIEECDMLTALAFSYDVLAGSGALTDAEQKLIEENIWKPGRNYMRRIIELHPSGGNWWIWHATGAIVLGVLGGDQELVDIGLNTPETGLLSMLRQGYVNADGFTGELSPGYHYYPFKALNRAAMATKSVGIDFYKLPIYKKLFDLPISITLPNLHMPRLNDGGEVVLNSDWAEMYELASHWYGDPAYQRFLAAIYGSAELGVKRDGLNALLFGPPTLDSTPLDKGQSGFLRASGLAILRSPLNDWTCILKDDRGSSGHRHPDALNLILFANGEDAIPGTGTTGYGHYSYLQWNTQSVAHNTVTLNTRSQRIDGEGKKIEFGLSKFGCSAVQSVAKNLQGKTMENENPALMRRTVVMTPHGIVDLFRVETDEARLAALKEKPPVNMIDWALHFYGDLAVDAKSETYTEALIPKERMEAPGKGHDFPHQGYKFLSDLKRIAVTKDPLHARLTQPAGGEVDVWLAPPGADTQVLEAQGLGLETNVEKKLPMILQRRPANDTLFAAVYAPFKDQPQVSSVRFLKVSPTGREAAVELVHANGKDLVLSLPEAGSLKVEGAALEGTLGCRVSQGNASAQWILVGTRWEDVEIMISLSEMGAVVVERTASGIRLHNGSDAPCTGEVKINSSNSKMPFSLKPNETKQMPVP
jgi:hypothetical protein